MTITFFRDLIFNMLLFVENSKQYIDDGKKTVSPVVKRHSARNRVTVTMGDETFDITISKRKGKNVRSR